MSSTNGAASYIVCNVCIHSGPVDHLLYTFGDCFEGDIGSCYVVQGDNTLLPLRRIPIVSSSLVPQK